MMKVAARNCSPLSGSCGYLKNMTMLLSSLLAEGVRLSISEGGCCASRSAYLGALLGGYGGFKQGQHIPAIWRQKYTDGFAAVVQAVQEICSARHEAALGSIS